jgi:hypothetical protein
MRKATSRRLTSAWSAVFAGSFCVAMRGGCVRERRVECETP